jgi:menaquinone-dependent protoporphyrinogen IX oxidase
MRALVMYYSESMEMTRVAKAIAAGIQKNGHTVDIKRIAPEVNPSSIIPYQIICVGAPVISFWGGKLSPGVSDFLGKCTHLTGKKMGAFTITKWFGQERGLRNLMGMMEKQGGYVIDFVGVKGASRMDLSRAEAFGARMGKVKV